MTVISIENTNISFSDIKNAYKNSNDTNASQNSSLRDGYTTTEISLSDFRNASFVKGNSVPSSGAISINTYFKGKTFGSLNKNFEGQSPSTSTGDWTPTNDHSGWENGSGAVNGTYWGLISNKNVKGWNLDNLLDLQGLRRGQFLVKHILEGIMESIYILKYLLADMLIVLYLDCLV